MFCWVFSESDQDLSIWENRSVLNKLGSYKLKFYIHLLQFLMLTGESNVDRGIWLAVIKKVFIDIRTTYFCKMQSLVWHLKLPQVFWSLLLMEAKTIVNRELLGNKLGKKILFCIGNEAELHYYELFICIYFVYDKSKSSKSTLHYIWMVRKTLWQWCKAI